MVTDNCMVRHRRNDILQMYGLSGGEHMGSRRLVMGLAERESRLALWYAWHREMCQVAENKPAPAPGTSSMTPGIWLMTHERLGIWLQRCSIQTMLVYKVMLSNTLSYLVSGTKYDSNRILGSGYMSNDHTEYNSTLSNERGGGE